LSAEALVIVATFYVRVQFIRGASTSPGLTAAAEEAFHRSADAAFVLENRGWWPWQRAKLHDALKELVVKA